MIEIENNHRTITQIPCYNCDSTGYVPDDEEADCNPGGEDDCPSGMEDDYNRGF